MGKGVGIGEGEVAPWALGGWTHLVWLNSASDHQLNFYVLSSAQNKMA